MSARIRGQEKRQELLRLFSEHTCEQCHRTASCEAMALGQSNKNPAQTQQHQTGLQQHSFISGEVGASEALLRQKAVCKNIYEIDIRDVFYTQASCKSELSDVRSLGGLAEHVWHGDKDR